MADKRTIAKRDGQTKLLQAMIAKGQSIMADLQMSRNPKKELAALLKNIQTMKRSIEELNENIVKSSRHKLTFFDKTNSNIENCFIPVNLGDPESTARISNVIFSVCSLSSFVLT